MGTYSQALLLTLAIEVPIYGVLLGPLARVFGRPLPSRSTGLAAGAVINLVSHPLAFLLVIRLLRPVTGSTVALVVVEVGIIVLEGAIIGRWLRVENVGLIASSVANITSLALGALFVG